MKTFRITYWITTSLVALMMTGSAYAYLTQDVIRQSFLHLGFPDYLRMELAGAKLLGAIVLLAPVGARIKEWAYAGLAITFVSAFIAHSSLADPIAIRIAPLVAMTLLAVSYSTYRKRLVTHSSLV